jgi:hypothetical protein
LVLLEKKTYGYRERDETGIDNREDYGYRWNELGQRFYDLKSGKRSIRVSIISALI